jgi:hypothetical protein
MAKPTKAVRGKAVARSGGAKGAPARGRTRRNRGANRLVLLLTVLALVPFSLPTLLVLFCGMLPTLGAALIDRSENRYAWICVGGLNFAGLVKWLLFLWFGHHDLATAIQQVTGVTMVLAAYAGAACGWLLYMAAPPVVTAIMVVTGKRRAQVLHAQQNRLVEIWGDGIISNIETEEIEIDF